MFDEKLILGMYDAGFSKTDIARELGITYSALTYRINKAIENREKARKAKEVNQELNLYDIVKDQKSKRYVVTKIYGNVVTAKEQTEFRTNRSVTIKFNLSDFKAGRTKLLRVPMPKVEVRKVK